MPCWQLESSSDFFSPSSYKPLIYPFKEKLCHVFSVVAARLYAAFIHAQLFVMSCRSKLTKYLLLIPMMLLPKAVLADGDLADMVRNVGEGAKNSTVIINHYCAVHRRNSVSRGLIGLKKLGNKGGWDWLVALYLSSLGRYLSPDLK